MMPSCQVGANPAVLIPNPDLIDLGRRPSPSDRRRGRSGIAVSKALLFFNRPGQSFLRSILLLSCSSRLRPSLGAFSIFRAVGSSNEMSAERQLRTADRSIRAAVQELAQQQEMVAVWDDLVMELGQNELDLKWIDANIGVWLCKTFGQDEVYILNERDEPISAAIASERVSVRDYDRVRAQIGSLVSGLRFRHGSRTAYRGSRQVRSSCHRPCGSRCPSARASSAGLRP